jgi:hypothetical protein
MAYISEYDYNENWSSKKIKKIKDFLKKRLNTKNKMDNKYYTPTIEEFHIGFEYELQAYDTKEWEYYQIEDKHDLFDACTEITRVKCLDQSDIESFGFVHKQYAGDGKYVLNFECREWHLNFWHNSSNPLIEIGRDGYDDGFFGKCKNKSELKRIINQLDIKTNG